MPDGTAISARTLRSIGPIDSGNTLQIHFVLRSTLSRPLTRVNVFPYE
jgi:hypothetical protein